MSTSALFAFILKFVRLQKWSFIVVFIVSFGWSLDQTLWPYLLQKVIDILTLFNEDRGNAWPALQLPVLAGLFLWISIELGFRCQGFMLARAIPQMEADIRMTMFDHVQRHAPKYFSERFAGSLANKITDMTTQVTLIVQQTLTMFVPAVAAFILACIFLAFINPLFALITAVWIVLHLAICIVFSQGCDRREHLHGEVRSTLIGKIVDSLSNHYAVNLYHRFFSEYSVIGQVQQEEKAKNFESKQYVEKMKIWLGLFTFLFGGVGLNGFLIYYWLHGRVTTGQVVQTFSIMWNMCMMLWVTGTAIPGFFQSIGLAKQALALMYEPQDLIDKPNSKPLHITRGEIIFENVSLHYGEKKLFQNKDVHIQPGEKVGLVGYSGAGKSSFINLILRLYPVESGRIVIDGQDISKVTLESLRRQIALIPQDPALFHRTVKENIRFGRLDATDQEVIEAAKLAHCDEFIKRMPKGYDSPVGERGSKLSGGERQRIAIARAILANAPILMLDEATSALDSLTESYIQESLSVLMQNRTSIVIAHRLSTLAGMDRILVFDEGKIIEQGSHAFLLMRGGHYARLWQLQAGGFLPEEPM